MFPMPHDHLAFFTHTGHHITKFTIPMCRLIEVHKIHVYGTPRHFRIELCVKMTNGFGQNRQAFNPHFSRREGVHPGDDTDTVFMGAGLLTQRGNFFWGFNGGLINDFYWNLFGGIQGLCNFFLICSYLIQGCFTVEVLATGYKPNFFMCEINRHLLILFV